MSRDAPPRPTPARKRQAIFDVLLALSGAVQIRAHHA
jgi:hypothetical protein